MERYAQARHGQERRVGGIDATNTVIISTHGRGIDEEEEEEKNAEPMEIDSLLSPSSASEEKLPIAVFPPSDATHVIEDPAARGLRFDKQGLPPTLIGIHIIALNPYVKLGCMIGTDKSAICSWYAMPMMIQTSPMEMLFAALQKDATEMIYSTPVVPWTRSAFQLLNLVRAMHDNLFPYHHSVGDGDGREYADQAMKNVRAFHEHTTDLVMETYRVARETPARTQEQFLKFVEYCEEFSIHFVHCMERALWKGIVEPHIKAHKLAYTESHFLTPSKRYALSDVVDVERFDARQEVVDFFTTHVLCIQAHAKQSMEDAAHVLRNPFDRKNMGTRIVVHKQSGGMTFNCRRDTVYRAYVDARTLYEYWLFSDSNNILGDDWNFDSNTFKF